MLESHISLFCGFTNHIPFPKLRVIKSFEIFSNKL